jgi:HSP20 family molecular chaperone IbpA
MTDDTVPFETTEDGRYRVTAPVSGMAPDSMEITTEGTHYRLSGCCGTTLESQHSQVVPDIIEYSECELVVE